MNYKHSGRQMVCSWKFHFLNFLGHVMIVSKTQLFVVAVADFLKTVQLSQLAFFS
jgi:hypothetical protein